MDEQVGVLGVDLDRLHRRGVARVDDPAPRPVLPDDLLVHEATFREDERTRARETGHSTAAQAARTARDAGVKLLALTHLSTRYFPREIRDEARATFENTVVPRDFDSIEVPFPERGEPHLVKSELVEAAP